MTTDLQPAILADRPTHVATTSLLDRLDEPDRPHLVDVRSPDDFASVHIPGSVNLPLPLLEAHRDVVVETVTTDVVLVCDHGVLAGTAHEHLASAGMDNVQVLDGGITAWRETGGEVSLGRERWALDRQIRMVAGSIVLASGLASTILPRTKWLGTAIGAGLTWSALSDTCTLGDLLSRLPYNRPGRDLDATDLVADLAGDVAPRPSRVSGAAA